MRSTSIHPETEMRALPLKFKEKARAEAPAMMDVKTITPGPVRGVNRGRTRMEPRAEPTRFEKYSLLIRFPALATARATVRPLMR